MTTPIVRIRDASLTPEGGPVRVTISRLASPEAVVDTLARAGATTTIEHGRLTTVTTPSRLVDAVGRASGAQEATTVEQRLGAAIAAWHAPPPDWQMSDGALPCSQRPIVMGILNVTPDSFSDAGRHLDRAVAIERGHALLDAGADVVDVGGESTRPGAEPVDEDEELARVLPVIEALAGDGATVSVDTTKAAVARAAVDAGAAIVNDVSAGAIDGLLLPTVSELRVPYVLMHMRGTPRTMQRNTTYADVVGEVFDFLAEGLERCTALGLDPLTIAVDPGIGFGKTVGHNLVLLRRIREFTSLGRPLLIGTSRKSFLGKLLDGADEDHRLEGSLATVAIAIARGAAVVRVHDVAETVRAVRVARAVAAAVSDDVPPEATP